MKPIDDELLRTSLRRTAESFDPSGGATKILTAAVDATHERTSVPDAEHVSEHPKSRRTRFAYAAAIVIAAVVALTSAGLVLRPDSKNSGGSTAALDSHGVSGIATPSLPSQNQGFLGVQFSAVTQDGKLVERTQSTNKASKNTTLASKVVSTGTISLSVSSGRIDDAITHLTTLAARQGGFVASSRVIAGTSGSPARGVITLRVPQRRFSALVAAVQKVGRTTSVVTNSTDVTSQYVDYESQISALMASRAQYLSIMAKATTINEILAVQAQLNTIEVELQQLEGQRNVLDNEAAYGTLTIKLNQHSGSIHVRSGINRAWTQSVSGFVTGFEGLVRALGPALFALLCLIAIWLVGRPAWRASRRRLL
jgi:hypothetical protein